MSDITKCKGNGCIKKETCYRYTSVSEVVYQSWFSDEIIWKLSNNEFTCDAYFEDTSVTNVSTRELKK